MEQLKLAVKHSFDSDVTDSQGNVRISSTGYNSNWKRHSETSTKTEYEVQSWNLTLSVQSPEKAATAKLSLMFFQLKDRS